VRLSVTPLLHFFVHFFGARLGFGCKFHFAISVILGQHVMVSDSFCPFSYDFTVALGRLVITCCIYKMAMALYCTLGRPHTCSC
jgi:hypothetical protein